MTITNTTAGTWLCWLSTQSPADRTVAMAWSSRPLEDAASDEAVLQKGRIRPGVSVCVRAVDLETGAMASVTVTGAENNDLIIPAVRAYSPRAEAKTQIERLVTEYREERLRREAEMREAEATINAYIRELQESTKP